MSLSGGSFDDLIVNEAATVRRAMECLNRNAREVVFVCNEREEVVGLITDGDIRRGLLAGRTLDSPVTQVMETKYFSVGQEVDRATVLDMMRARHFQHVPVLDANRRLAAVHFLRDLIGASVKPNVAVIMAGGRGTRLRPVTETIPKPMVEVAGRPILERIVLHLVSHGIQRIYLAVNYKAEMIENHFGDGTRFGCSISYLRENEPRGTGGALSLLPVVPSDPFIVLNGDQVTRTDLTEMLECHRRADALATMGVGPYQHEIPFGTVTESEGRLLTLQEKPSMSVLVNRGIYVLEPELIAAIPGSGEFPITALFETLLGQNKPVNVFYFDDYWLDVGRPADLRQANGMT